MFMTEVCACVSGGRNGVTQHSVKEAIHGGVNLALCFFALKAVSCAFIDPRDLAPQQRLGGVTWCLMLH